VAKVPKTADSPQKSAILRGLIFYLRHLSIWCILAAIVYWAWLDHRVIAAFDQRRWDLPARIYAAPLEIYANCPLAPDQFVRTLEQLGYREVRAPTGAGQFAQDNDAFDVDTRGFTFADGTDDARSITVRFDRARVAGITDRRTGAQIGVARFEPLEIGRIHADQFEDRVLVTVAELPEWFARMLIAVEDRRFYQHIGVDWIGILRALWVNLREGGIAQGGSTLTQQLVKNMYLDRQRTLWRKLNEALMALSLERRYSKQEILETYVNEVFLGQDGNRAIHGFGLASQFYFGRPLAELSIPEAALLVGLVRGPSHYNPFKYPERALARREVVLATLRDSGLISQARFERYRSSPLAVRHGQWPSGRYAAFLDLVRRQLKRDYRETDLQNAGLKIFTTLDIVAQAAAEASVAEVLPQLERGRPKLQGALQAAVVITDARTADIKAIVGSRDGNVGDFNRALDARRQIGSLVKPFVYMTGFAQLAEFNVLSVLHDEPRQWRGDDGKVWAPKNYDGKYRGEVHARDAIAQSLNLATIDLGFRVGVDAVRRTLARCGFEAEIPRYPALFLGAMEMSPYDVAQLYQVIANDGFRFPLRAIQAVVDKRNQPIKRYGMRVERVAAAAPSFLTRYLLTRVVELGTAQALARQFPQALPLAGKTGTSDDARDSWFVGFTGTTLAAVWIGRDDNRPAGLTGATGALRVWSRTMSQVGVAPLVMDPPPTVEWHWLTADGTGLASDTCPGAVNAPIDIEHLPRTVAPCDSPPSAVSGPWWNRR
jgi:penicillin-binding protein 1B